MKAIIFNLLAWVMLPIMDGFAKYLSADMPVLQITWARYFFTVAFTLPIMFLFYNKQLVWTDKPKLQIIRGLILLSANICFFYAISVISLAKALTLAFVAPLIVTAFSPLLLGEKVGIRRWTAVIIGFIGSLVVIRPGFVEINLASLAALGTGIMYGFYLIITRKLSTSDNPLLTLLLTGLVGAGGGFLIIPALVILSKLPMKQAVGTSLLIVAAKSLIGFTGDLGKTTMDWPLLLLISGLAIVGIFIGSILAKRIAGERLKVGFGWFVLVMGIYIIVKELFFASPSTH